MSEILFRNFQLLVGCGLLHQLLVTEISDAFCHSVVQQNRSACIHAAKLSACVSTAKLQSL
jgi:hypothetical protein